MNDVLVAGEQRGSILVLDEPISFWGGVEMASGRIVDRRHPQRGQTVSGRILVMEHGRGSSSSSSVLAEMIRQRTGPVALVLGESDPMLVLGSVVAEELYGIVTPVIVAGPATRGTLRTGHEARILPDGAVITGEATCSGNGMDLPI